MKTIGVIVLAAILVCSATASSTDVSGEQWGTWTRDNSPYNVVGEIRVPPGSTLVIEPGVVVNFQGHYKFIVDSLATLLAAGTETDSIYVTAEDTATSWHGIRFLSASDNSQIRYCRLEYGKATGSEEDAKGGAIYCSHCNLTISHNTIRLNSAYLGGGGIYCEHSRPTIRNNTIRENSSTAARGGGINCWESSPTVRHNIIFDNSAGSYGGGIHCRSNSNLMIRANTISRNSASDKGGAIYCEDSTPTITNTILWGDTAPQGPEIYVYGGSDPVVRYCDVQGGWEGTGNINADPIFVGVERDDFLLRWRSPGIDAGEPSLTDPDGTRSDIGAFYFNQAVPGVVELYPRETPIVIPPEGGNIVYDGWIFNFLGYPGPADIWAHAFVPGIGRYGPIELYRNFPIPADSIGMNRITQQVPGFAPAGDYVFAAYVGIYPNTIIDSSYFYFSKEGSVSGGVASWFEGNKWLKGTDPAQTVLPTEPALSQNYPNPFNASTVIEYQLPQGSTVRLEVYNVLGEKVVTLVNGAEAAGHKSVTWEASEVSSGIYFYKLSAGDFSEVYRMTLLK